MPETVSAQVYSTWIPNSFSGIARAATPITYRVTDTNGATAEAIERVNVWAVEALFSVVIALVVAMSIAWIGLLVINSLLILPAAAARNLARNTAAYLGFALLFSFIAGIAGLIVSFYAATATGATIVLVALGLFLLTVPLRRR